MNSQRLQEITVEVYGRSQWGYLPTAFATQIALTRKVSIMRTKSGLLIAIITAASLALTGCATVQQPETVTFLKSKFVADGYVEGFTPGSPDVGFTLEAIAQLSQAPGTDLSAAEKWALTDTSKLVDADGNLQLGLAAKWLYVSDLVGFSNDSVRDSVTEELTSYWNSTDIIERSTNSFDLAWEALALEAVGRHDEARKASDSLSKIRRADNGWGTDLSANTTASSTDATAIALMAFIATGDTSSAEVAKAWLNANLVTDHYEAWGDVDVNGTAYATMALHASGSDVTKLQAWLKGQLAKDGGLKTPWSNGAGDTFATIQGYLPLIGLDYVGIN